MTAIAATMQAFFTERLISQRRASPHTIAAYRDTLRLLLGFAASRTRIPPCRLDIADLDAPVIAAFLDHLEHQRGNSTRTRNARLAVIHSLFGYAALRHPEHAADIARVLAIPSKRADQAVVTFLTDPEAEALLAAPDRATRTGRRDPPGSSSRSRPGCGPPSSPGSPAAMFTSAPAPTSPATAKAAKTASPR